MLVIVELCAEREKLQQGFDEFEDQCLSAYFDTRDSWLALVPLGGWLRGASVYSCGLIDSNWLSQLTRACWPVF